MSLNSTYHRITGFATLMVLLWNIVGWLGFGFVLNHAHTHHDGNYCEITFCTCEVEEAGDVCTCHHQEMQTQDKHSDTHDQHEECYFSLPHDSNTSSTQALIVVSKFNALHLNSENLSIPLDNHEFQAEQQAHLLSGTIPDLLRPPRV
ncbi:hypothetical protein [Gracilimonas halophila]|uniref:Uncharacterized protein n=1 Tax=Gracilimonas halophila TaxID=1834464 RepID=A0ABW5JN67_9BACT